MVRDLDLAEALRAVGEADDVAVDVDAGFFHRTLARWLGLPEGRADVQDPVRWDYDLWKATFEALPPEAGPPVLLPGAAADPDGVVVDERELFAADLFRSKAGPVERVSWFIKKDARGRIVEAGWLSPAPRLIDPLSPSERPLRAAAGDDPVTLDEETVRRLLDDDLEG